MTTATRMILSGISGVVLVLTSPLAIAQAAAQATLGAAPPGSPQAEEPSSGASSEVASDTRHTYEKGGLAGIGLVPGLKAGGGLGLGAFGATPLVELEVGYLLPPLRRSIEVFVSGGYAQPKAEESSVGDTYGPDSSSRLPGEMKYEITERQVIVTLGGLYRVPLDVPLVRPYGGLGGRLYLTKAVIDASAGGESFGDNEETDTSWGFFGALGAEAYLGPGAALLELQFGYANVDAYVLRNAKSTSLNLALGYRLFL